MAWSELGDWWISEVSDDPTYETVVTPLLLEMLEPEEGRLYLDLGCGEGRVMRAVARTGALIHGLDVNPQLAAVSIEAGPTVVAVLPDLSSVRADSYDGAFCVLVLEHIADYRRFFENVATAVRSGGLLCVVMNHPVWTAPRSTPITDGDGEVLWRPGDYFSNGITEEPAGDNTVSFHHRSLADIVNSAADAGWSMEKMIELPHEAIAGQEGIPRLLACRWRLLP